MRLGSQLIMPLMRLPDKIKCVLHVTMQCEESEVKQLKNELKKKAHVFITVYIISYGLVLQAKLAPSGGQ